VYSAVTPLARDLTTHMGKGMDPTSARVSALMEAIERVSAEHYAGPVQTASWQALTAAGACALDPRWFDLPEDSAFSPARPISWVAGRDLLADREVLLPLDLVINPPAEGVLRDVDTNGLASGNTLVEAVVHGLCEVIERDAVGQLLFAHLFGDPLGALPRPRRVDPGTLPAELYPWLERIAATGLALTVADITNDIGVATFKATLVDDAFPGPQGPEVRIFLGYGADPCAAVAVRRALTEAVQSRTGTIQAARDAFNYVSLGTHVGAWRSSLRDLEPAEDVSFAAVPTFESDDLRDDLAHVLDRLRRAGASHVVAVELTRPDLDVPVVRVRVPGLVSFLGNRRRVGWRCLRHLL
jgi:ribosomal protein S12 methylthiotransferase accessory factor